eukprot:TRINITY_DN892_c0_g1_i3.p1 TRINITY_DN892_c0_g1~~TRINITY_DN892_c0_g1_i3.p1  ORF type:complete len:2289 (-),score=618.48 TRINITY_DN892_c0_g1_i3:1290-8156(-)
MSPAFNYVVGSQLRFLVTQITKANYDVSAKEIRGLVDLYGIEASNFLAGCLVQELHLRDLKTPKDQLKAQLFVTELKNITAQPGWPSALQQAFQPLEPVPHSFVSHLGNLLKLAPAFQVAIALALGTSENEQTSDEGYRFLKDKLIGYLNSFIQEGVRNPIPQEVLLFLLFTVRTKSPLQSVSSPVLTKLKDIYPEKTQSHALATLLTGTSADIHQIRRELNFDAKLANTGAEAAVLFADMKIGSKPASVLRDLGYAATAGSAEPLQQALSQFQVITEADVASMLGLMIRTMRSLRSSVSDEGNQGSEGGWNFDVFVDCVIQANAGLDWKQVALALDHPEFVVHDIDALNALVGALQRGSKDPSFYPVESLVGRGLWNNQFGQLTFLRNAVIASPEGFNFTTSPRQQAVPQHLNRQYSDSMSAWLSLDLLEVLLAQADSEHYPLVRTAIEQPKQQCPELLLFGLAQVKSNASNPLRSDILAALVPIYLSSNANSQAVYHKLWALDQSVIIQGMAETYSKDPATLSRLLEIAQDLKALTTILEGQPYSFTIDLAALASRREYLNLEKWLTHHVSSAGAPFVKAATKYLKDKTAVKPGETAKNTSTFQLSVDTLATFFKCLNSGSGFIPREIAEELKLVYTTCSQMHPRLITLAPDPSQAEVFSPEIDDEANRKFQEIYKGDVTVLQAVTMLQQYRDSSNQREKDVFACMIHNLFDEYRFFPKYPEKELRITGDLFGAIINQNLVSSFRLGLALRYVLEALRKPPQSSMYIFGILALDRFKGRLHEWPQYCVHITQMTHLPAEILQLTKRILADPASAAAAAKAAASQRSTKDPSPVISGQSGPEVSPSLSAGSRRAGATPGTPGQAPSLQSTLNIDTLLTAADDIVMPDEAVLDKIHFIFNNLSTQNMEQKLAEMKAIYREEYVPYLAQYLVVKRASIEPNFHQLYITFLTNLHIPTLWTKITNTTLFNVQVLLNSEKTLTSSAERSLLKNLGSWLGHLTIARNKPLLHKNLDLKKLIYKCYVNRRLIAVIPFVAKVLESCKKSKIFAPPNPWLMAVMGLLAELYHVHDLKLNLKFEIEVLCKNLNLELGDIKQTKMLNFRPRSKVGGVSFGTPSGLFTGISDASPFSLMSLSTADKTSLLIPPSSAKSDGPDSPLQETGTVTTTPSVGAPLGSITPGQMPPGTTTPGQVSTAAAAGAAPASTAANLTNQDYEATVIPNLASFVQINPAIALFHQEPNRRRVVPVAVDRAIREIISPVVERSVTIACITTRELCIKDFAMEPGETNIRKSAHLMVQHLAGSLALVTCKEPLRVSMSNHLRSLLQGSMPGQDPRQRQIEEAVQVISAENLELGCTLIEKAATDKAIHDIDEALAPAYSIRHSHMEATGQPYYDHSTLNATRYPAALPKPLRPAPAAHRNNSVYDDFSRLMRSKTAGYPGSATGAAGGAPQAAATSAATPGGPGSTPPGVVPVAGAPPAGQPGFSAGTSPEGPQGSINPGLLGQGGQQQSGAQQQASNSLQKGFASVADPVVKPNQTQQSKPSYETLTTQQCLEKFTQQLMELDKMLERTNVQDVSTLPSDHEVIKAMSQVPHLITLSITRDDSALAFAQTIFKRLYVLPDPRHRSVHLKLLEAITGVCNKVIKELTSWVIYSDDERKFNRDVTPGLVRHRLLDVAEFDQHLAKQIDNSRNPSQAVDFAVYLVRSYLINEQRVSPCELINVLDVLHNVASFKGGGPELKQVVDQARSTQNSAILQAAQEITRKELPLIANPDDPDPNGFRDQVIYLFEEWLTLVKAAPPPESRVSDATAGNYIRQLMQHHLLANPDLAARFMRICTEVCLAKYLWAGQGIVESQHQSRQYQTLDAFAQLIVFVVQSDHFNPQQSLQLFKQALEGVTQVLFRDSQVRQYNFDQRPYHRLLATWLVELSGQNIDKPNVPIVEVLCQTLLRLQPTNSPGFAFSWLHLVSHRMLMPVLLSNQEQGWPIFHTLLCSLFVFLRPHLASAELNDAMRMMYKGTLRVLLVLLHDFPEYLCDFHFSLIDLIPTSCIQLRNLILSAFPRNMRLPDPFTPNLKVDLLPEISQPPRILSDYRSALRRNGLLEAVDQYLQTRKGLQNLVPRLTIPQKELKFGQSQYRISVLNALVLHVGMQAVIHLQQMKSPSNPPPHPAIQPSAPLDIFQRLVAELDSEGRYLFFNAIANQLRYPNNHTHYFSFVMLYLFKETRNEVVREQITRVLLERLIVNRPHPWGLLITFIELIKNPMYSFWSHEFTRCAPEIQRLFDSVARSCMGRTY